MGAEDPIKDDMSIVLGIQELSASATTHRFNVKDAIMKLLQDELGLEVLFFKGPKIVTPTINKSEENVCTRRSGPPRTKSESSSPSQSSSLTPTRRPAVLQSLKVPKESLLQWLQRRFDAS